MKERAGLALWVMLAIAVGLWSSEQTRASSSDAKTENREIQKEAADAEREAPAMGLLAFREKSVFPFLRQEKDWSLAMVDVPVGDGDIFYSDTHGRSDVTFPNDSKIRINDKSKIQFDQVKS